MGYNKGEYCSTFNKVDNTKGRGNKILDGKVSYLVKWQMTLGVCH